MDWRRLSLLRVVGDRSQGISRLKLSLMESVTTNAHYCCPTGKCSYTVSDKVLSLSSRLCQSKEATLRCTNRSKSKSFWMRKKISEVGKCLCIWLDPCVIRSFLTFDGEEVVLARNALLRYFAWKELQIHTAGVGIWASDMATGSSDDVG